MNKEIIMLDTNIIGKVINTSSKKDVVIRCQQWFRHILNNYLIYIPEIADYEVRRKLLHINSIKSIEMLEDIKQLEFVVYAPITTAIMLKAAELWAEARKNGLPTATEKEVDGDVILAATAIIISKQENKTVIIATENRKHLQIYHPNTKHWEDEF